MGARAVDAIATFPTGRNHFRMSQCAAPNGKASSAQAFTIDDFAVKISIQFDLGAPSGAESTKRNDKAGRLAPSPGD